MKELRVRNIDDGVIAAMQARARREGTSVSELVREMLAAAVSRPREELLERLTRLQANILRESGITPDSAPGIRAERDARG